MMIENESMPKIVVNDTINLLFKAAVSISAVSDQNRSG